MDTQEAKSSDVDIATRGRIRKGKKKMDTASEAARNYCIDLYNKGYAKQAIVTLLKRDYNISIDTKAFGNWMEKQTLNRFKPGTDTFKEEASKEFANVYDGLLEAQRAIKSKFDQAIKDDDSETIQVYAKLLNDNIETAHKIFMDLNKTDKKPDHPMQTSFGQMLENMSKRKVVEIPDLR